MEKITRTFYDGKYTLIREPCGHMYALRYGEPWRELSGDNLIYFMLMRITDLEEEIENLKKGDKMLVKFPQAPNKQIRDFEAGEPFRYNGQTFMKVLIDTKAISFNLTSSNPNVAKNIVVCLETGIVATIPSEHSAKPVTGHFQIEEGEF